MATQTYDEYDVVTVGHGISGLATALSASERGANTVILEKSPRQKRGGHSRYAGGSFRFPMEKPKEIQERFDLEVPPERYSKQKFYSDLMQLSGGRADPDLCNILVENNYETVQWLNEYGVEFTTRHTINGKEEVDPMKKGGKGERLRAKGEGAGVIDVLSKAVKAEGIDVHYGTAMRELLTDDGTVTGVRAKDSDGELEYHSDSVVICAGSYVSCPEKRTRYIGKDADAYIVRGSRYNTGEAIESALNVDAAAEGQWGGAHQVMVDARAPDVEGGRTRVNGYQYGIILNENGERFVDEGENRIGKTYAKFGKAVYEQPNQLGFVVLDSSISEYLFSQLNSKPVTADSIETLCERVGITDPERAAETVRAYNDATDDDVLFDPGDLDGKSAASILPRKSNWAVPLDEPPFYCIPVRPGITFAFGGLKIDTDARVIDTQENPIPGLWAVGNSTAGIFYGNYAAGTALARGATFGRIAGASAATYNEEAK